MFRILALLLLPVICLAQVNSNGEKPTGELLSNEIAPNDMKRNASFNLDEIKVRWKKAALENCTGVPCVVTPPAPSFTCGTSTVSDYDGNVYETVAIVGTSVTQCWTKSNLKVTRYNDGTLIPDLTASSNNPWATKSGARTEYVNGGVPLSGYVGTFGYLYNWYAAAGIITIGGSPTKNICPTGWHVPTDSDWNKLVIYIHSGADTITTTAPFAQSTTAGGKLKSTGTNTSAGTGFGWDPATLPSPVTDDYGFSALPGGIRGSGGSSFSIRQKTYFWSATDSTNPSTWSRLLEHVDVEVKRSSTDKDAGFSVRCLKD
jgi:uncharacterized protein (TIGR02145 family)